MKPLFTIATNIYVNIISEVSRCLPTVRGKGNSVFSMTFSYKPYLMFMVLIAIIFYSNLHAQTAIVVKLLNNEIFVGADSYEIMDEKSPPRRVCKIRQGPGFYYAITGVAEWIGTPLNVHDIIAQNRDRGENVLSRIRLISGDIGDMLSGLLDSAKTVDPLGYENYLKRIVRITILFFWFENDSAKVRVVNFRIVEESISNVAVGVLGGTRAFVTEYLPYGENEEMKHLLQANSSLERGKPVTVIKRLINEAAKFHPHNVGPPIDILHITKSGPRWIQKKKNCQN